MTGGDPLQPQDLVVTLLGTYVRPFGRAVWSGGLVMLLREFGFSDGAARAALTRLVRRDLIARVRSGRLVHYSLTPRCERLLIEGDGRIFTLGRLPANIGPWTVLWHQIPEDRRLERGRLGRRLRFLGFGSVQDSVWVSPHDHRDEVAHLLGELGVAEHAIVFISLLGSGSGGGLPALVARAWDLSGLEERYDAFCSGFDRYLAPDAPAGVGSGGVSGPHAADAHVPRLRPARPRTARGARAAVGAAHARRGDLRGAVHGAVGVVAASLRRGDVRAGAEPHRIAACSGLFATTTAPRPRPVGWSRWCVRAWTRGG